MTGRFAPTRSVSSKLAETLAQHSPYSSAQFLFLFEHIGGRSGYLLAETEGKVVGALAVVEFGFGPITRMQALVDGLPSPVWVAPEEKGRLDEIHLALETAFARRKYAKVTIVDYDLAWGNWNGRECQCETTVVNLRDAIRAGEMYPPDRTLRSEISKAHREHVRVAKLDSRRHIGALMTLIDATEERHGRKPKYSTEFWLGFMELAESDERFRVFGVEADGRLAAAHVFIVDRNCALNWQVYFDKEFSPLKPNQAITSFVIQELGARGVEYLNLGRSPAEAAGLETYKNKWGGQTYRYRTIEYRSWAGRLFR